MKQRRRLGQMENNFVGQENKDVDFAQINL